MSGRELSGIGFPFQFNASGSLGTATGASKVKANLISLIKSKKGERVVMSGAGTVGYDRLLRSASATSGIIPALITEAAMEYEPRVSGIEAKVRTENGRSGTIVVCELKFKVNGSEEQIPVKVELT